MSVKIKNSKAVSISFLRFL